MKPEETQMRSFAIIGGLVAATILINGFFVSHGTHRRAVKAEQARERTVAAEREQLARETREKQEREQAAAAQKEEAARQARAEQDRLMAAQREREAQAAAEFQERERIAAEKAREESARQAAAQREREAKEAIAREEREKVEAERREQLAKEQAAQAARDAEARAEAARLEAIAEHARYLARYLNTNFARVPQTTTVAVAAGTEEMKANRELVSALVTRFKTDGFQILPTFFRPELVADGLLGNLIAARPDVIAKLELTNHLDALLLGQQHVDYSTNAALENTVTANLRFELTTLPVRNPAEKQSWKFSATGVGFQPQEARAMAEERLLQQLVRDSNMRLPSGPDR
jgi:chemotaxis protein histidine kinase CheA